MRQSCNACDETVDGPIFAAQFRLPTATTGSKGDVSESFAAQFTRHCNLLELGPGGEDLINGPHSKGIVRYQLKCNRDPETLTVTGKWRVYFPQLGITLNLKSQGAVTANHKLKFVGVHSV